MHPESILAIYILLSQLNFIKIKIKSQYRERPSSLFFTNLSLHSQPEIREKNLLCSSISGTLLVSKK